MSDERITYTGTNRQIWRQVGWLGGSGRLYDMTATDVLLRSEKASYGPVWQLIDDEPMIQPVAAVRYGPGRTAEVFQGSGVNVTVPSGVWIRVSG